VKTAPCGSADIKALTPATGINASSRLAIRSPVVNSIFTVRSQHTHHTLHIGDRVP
jgi:hypothetical protein